MPIPYRGYTWHFTQHAVAYEQHNLFGLLRAAALWNSQEPDSQAINRLLASENVLTTNERAGRPDAWRDYQQVLAELGLIFSTELSPILRVTELGLSLLDGEIGYAEALTTQALRYQYPNGFKNAISPRVRQELNQGVLGRTSSLIDLQIETGVLIKPGVLIVESLLALNDHSPENAFLTNAEIQTFLLEVFHFTQEIPDPAAIIARRRSRRGGAHYGVPRNIQDWTRLLRRTDLCSSHFNGGITLSDTANRNIERVRALVNFHKKPESYWIPQNSSQDSRMHWFGHYGSVNLDSEWVVSADDLTRQYEVQNYPMGSADANEFNDLSEVANELTAIGPRLRLPEAPAPPRQGPPPQFLVPGLGEIEAARARHEKSKRLHAAMIDELPRILVGRGAEVYEDPASIDLLVRLGGVESIIEVKTVQPRNVRPRVRLGIGQLFEYQYRREKEIQQRPTLALAISSNVKRDDPIIDFLNGHLNMALITRSDAGAYSSFRPVRGTPIDLI